VPTLAALLSEVLDAVMPFFFRLVFGASESLLARGVDVMGAGLGAAARDAGGLIPLLFGVSGGGGGGISPAPPL